MEQAGAFHSATVVRFFFFVQAPLQFWYSTIDYVNYSPLAFTMHFSNNALLSSSCASVWFKVEMSCYQNFRFAACFPYETITQAIESSVSWVNTKTFKFFFCSVAVRFVTNTLSLQLHWNLIRSHLNLFILLPVQPCGPPKLFLTCVGKHVLTT